MKAKRAKESYAVGLDLGGTKLAAALVRSDGQIVNHYTAPVHLKNRDGYGQESANQSQTRVIRLMGELVDQVLDEAKISMRSIEGVGLASAGPMNIAKGTLNHPANFVGWKVVSIVRRLEGELKRRGRFLPVGFQNDAIAAALAERWVGHAQKMETFVVVTIGTGIGTGVILNGLPCQSHGMGSEWGHMLLEAGKSVEDLAAGPALHARLRQMGIHLSHLDELKRHSRKRQRMILDPMTDALATLCFNLSIGFHLQGIFLSGGVTGIKQLFLPDLIKKYRARIQAFNGSFACPIKIARTGVEAGVIGAAALGFHRGFKSSLKA